jgi:alkylated DNA repair dioxygenase AlkB
MEQLDFLSITDPELQREMDNPSRVAMVRGLTYIPEYITQPEHDRLLEIIDLSENWSDELRRRVQHYGCKYNYSSRSIDAQTRPEELPAWCVDIAKKFERDNFIKQMSDQVIVNEYLPGQGIAKHVDCEPCFAETILSLSLGSKCLMDFTHRKTLEKVEVLLEPRSLIILEGDARYLWCHGIAARKTDKFNNTIVERQRRVSITFRKVLLPAAKKAKNG